MKTKLSNILAILIILVLAVAPVYAATTTLGDPDALIEGDLEIQGELNVDNITVEGNTIETSTGGLILKGSSGEIYALNPADSSSIFYIRSYEDDASGVVGRLFFRGRDSGASSTNYAYIQTEIVDPTNASEDGKIGFGTITDGSGGIRAYLDGDSLDFQQETTITTSSGDLIIDPSGGNVDITGDLTVDGTIYGEVAQDLVLSAPEGYNVEIGADGTVEMDLIKAITGDTLKLDDHLEFQGARTISNTSGDLTISPYEDLALGTIGNPTSLDVTYADIYAVGDVDLEPSAGGVVSIEYGSLEFSAGSTGTIQTESGSSDDLVFIPDSGEVEIEGTDLYLEYAGEFDIYTAQDLRLYGGDDITLEALNDIFFEVGVGDEFIFKSNNSEVFSVDGNSVDIASGIDLIFNSNLAMDDTGFSDPSGNTHVSSDTGVLTLNAGASDQIIFTVDDAAVGYFDDAGDSFLYVYGDVDATGYNTHSDIRLKQNIIEVEDLLGLLRQIDVVRYQLISSPDEERIGVIAQQLEEVFPEFVNCEGDHCTVSSDLWMATIRAVQELADKVDELEARLERLEAALEGK